jgi:hypothetical protein
VTTQAVGDILATYRASSVEASDLSGHVHSSTHSVTLHGNLGEEFAFAVALANVWNGPWDSFIGSADGTLNLGDFFAHRASIARHHRRFGPGHSSQSAADRFLNKCIRQHHRTFNRGSGSASYALYGRQPLESVQSHA